MTDELPVKEKRDSTPVRNENATLELREWSSDPAGKKYKYEPNQFWIDMILRSSEIWNKIIE